MSTMPSPARDMVQRMLPLLRTRNLTELYAPGGVHDTTDPGVLVAEYDALVEVRPAGTPFSLRLQWVLGVADGEIASRRDYWNPVEVLGLQGVTAPARAR